MLAKRDDAELDYLREELGLSIAATHLAAVCAHYHLSPSQGRLLLALYQAHPRVLTIAQIDDAVPSPTGRERAIIPINVLVHRARKQVGREAILTAPGGYRLSTAGAQAVSQIINP